MTSHQVWLNQVCRWLPVDLMRLYSGYCYEVDIASLCSPWQNVLQSTVGKSSGNTVLSKHAVMTKSITLIQLCGVTWLMPWSLSTLGMKDCLRSFVFLNLIKLISIALKLSSIKCIRLSCILAIRSLNIQKTKIYTFIIYVAKGRRFIINASLLY